LCFFSQKWNHFCDFLHKNGMSLQKPHFVSLDGLSAETLPELAGAEDFNTLPNADFQEVLVTSNNEIGLAGMC